jgi:hypothetical protein
MLHHHWVEEYAAAAISAELVQALLRPKRIALQDIITAVDVQLLTRRIHKQITSPSTNTAVAGDDFPFWKRRREVDGIGDSTAVAASRIYLDVV